MNTLVGAFNQEKAPTLWLWNRWIVLEHYREPYRGPAGICPPPGGTAHWWGTLHLEELWSPAEGSPRGEASRPREYSRTVCGGQQKRLHGQTRHEVRWWRTLKSWHKSFACPSLDWWVMNDMIHYIPDNVCLWIILLRFYIRRQLTNLQRSRRYSGEVISYLLVWVTSWLNMKKRNLISQTNYYHILCLRRRAANSWVSVTSRIWS